MDLVGRTLGAYEITAHLGAGGMGQVYRARDSRLGRDVALKVLPDALAEDPTFIARFEREAQLLAAVEHPGIVTIHSVEHEDGIRFLTMQLVEGVPLQSRIPAAGLPLDQLLDWAIELADAIAAAHRRDIIHRDLKPANVMVAGDGRLRVLDFGLAKERGAADTAQTITSQTPTITVSEELTAAGAFMGTVGYMPPEQAEGREVDARADVWSLGVILYQMATGQTPFQGDSVLGILAAVVKDPARPLRERRPDVPRELERIVQAALQKDPERRTQSAQELRNQLMALREEPAPAEAVAHTPARRRGPGWPAVIAGMILTAILGFGLGRMVVPGTPDSGATDATISMERVTSSGRVWHATVSPDGRLVAYVEMNEELASLRMRQLTTGGETVVVESSGDFLLRPEFDPGGEFLYYIGGARDDASSTDTATLFRVPVLGGVSRKILDDTRSAVRIAPDGQRALYVQQDSSGSRMVVRDLADGSVIPLDPGEGELMPPMAWSPDGRFVAAAVYIADAQGLISIQIHDLTTGTSRLLPQDWGALDHLAWPDDDAGLIVSAASDQSNWLFHLWRVPVDGRPARNLTPGTSNYLDVSASRGGEVVTAVSSDWFTDIWRAPGGNMAALERLTEGFEQGAFGLTSLADGRVVQVRRDFRISVLDPETGREAVVDGENSCRNLDAHPSEPMIVYDSWRGGDMAAWVQRADGSGLRKVIPAQPADAYPRFAGDGDWIVYRLITDDTESIAKVPIGGGEPTILVPTGARAPAVSPDGQRVAYVPDDGRGTEDTVRIIALNDGQELARLSLDLPVDVSDIWSQNLCWTPDGEAISLAIRTLDGGVNIWRVPLDGSTPSPVTGFTTEFVRKHAWTADGDLLLTRGTEREDVVLIRNTR